MVVVDRTVSSTLSSVGEVDNVVSTLTALSICSTTSPLPRKLANLRASGWGFGPPGTRGGNRSLGAGGSLVGPIARVPVLSRVSILSPVCRSIRTVFDEDQIRQRRSLIQPPRVGGRTILSLTDVVIGRSLCRSIRLLATTSVALWEADPPVRFNRRRPGNKGRRSPSVAVLVFLSRTTRAALVASDPATRLDGHRRTATLVK